MTNPTDIARALSEYWMPIETAPRDGSFFLAARFVEGCRYRRYGYAAVDRWHGREIDKKDSYSGLGEFNGTHWPATHWMPLPEFHRPTIDASTDRNQATVVRCGKEIE